jgi:TatD DNase family protein
MKLFNFHTHNINEENGIINCFPDAWLPANKLLSCGLHPWNYSVDFMSAITKIEKLATSQKIIALGETGLDPKSPVDLSLQKEIFIQHLVLSDKFSLPLIIHCVKYYNDLISIIKKHKPTQALILHGFNGKITIAKELLENGFYFSVSESILKNPEKARQFFALVPTDRLFLETDDADADISNIYNFVAGYHNVDLYQLVKIIEDNLKRIGI